MVRSVGIRSRFWNFVLAVVGTAYVAAALSILLYYIASAGDGASLMDRLLQLGLAGAVAAGAWFLVSALHNLGIHFHRPHHR